MAYSQIEDKYLSALTTFQFPDMPVEPVVPEQGGPMGTMPGDIQLAEAGSRGMPEQAYSGSYPDTIKSYDPTVRERLATLLQSTFEGLGMDRYKARQNAQTMIGGESSNLPLSMGLADFVPFLGTGMQTQEAAIMGGEALQSAKQGNYGTAALQAGGAAVGMIPGIAGTAKAVKMLPKNLPTGLSTEAVGGMGNVLQAPSKPVLNRQEKAVISVGAEGKKQIKNEATDLATNMKSNYPQADGWVPIEIG